LTLTDWLDASRDQRERARRDSLALIAAADVTLLAWAQVAPQPPLGSGPLDGIPFGAKDVFETRGLRTEYGSPIYAGRVGTEDAAIVRQLREQGAVLLGKTHTAAFAHRTPAPTRNPRNPAHTPGGSSSGSAAAVAAGMVPLALGTQTKGSVLRPASYCGVTGFKPTYDAISSEGVLPLSKSLDTVGFFTDTAADMLALWELLSAEPHARGAALYGPPDLLAAVDPLPPGVDPVMAKAFAGAIDRLRAAGARIERVDIAAELASLNAANDLVMIYEGARVHHERYEQYGSRLGEIAELVRRGRQVTDAQYRDANASIEASRAAMATVFAGAPVVLLPAATGPAPAGLGSTGDARMNAPWTTMGTPAVSIPLPVEGMPLGLQLTAGRGEDTLLLRAAAWAHGSL
jgi:amidase